MASLLDQLRSLATAPRPPATPTRRARNYDLAFDEKPPFRVPSMAEVRAAPRNGLVTVSTFAGCGGSCLGFEMAGYSPLWVNEFIPAARECYAANREGLGVVVDGRDVRDVLPEEILEALGGREVDVLEGSPPCESFSTAGIREAGWGKVRKYGETRQRQDDLFFEFVRLLAGLRPRAFVAENVPGLRLGAARAIYDDVLVRLASAGYRVECRLLDAQWYGVPQSRRRLIFVGVRADLGLDPAFPDPLSYRYSVREALPWLTAALHDTSGLYGSGDFLDRAAPAITKGVNSVNSAHYRVAGDDPGVELDLDEAGVAVTDDEEAERAGEVALGTTARGTGFADAPRDLDDQAPTILSQQGGGRLARGIEGGGDIARYAIGREWDRTPEGGQSDRYFNLIRPDRDGPSPTITKTGGQPGAAGVVHPTERRKFTMRELRRICGFPDDFVLTGTYRQQWERLGNAVPPLMMRAVAEALRDRVLLRR